MFGSATISATALPFNLNPTTGQVTQTPFVSGSPLTLYTISVTDSLGGTASRICNLTVAQPVTTCPTLPMEIGQTYSYQFSGSGGVPQYTWSGANAVTGLSVTNGGLYSGTVGGTTTGSVSLTVAMSDAFPATITTTCSVTVYGRLTLSCPTPFGFSAGSATTSKSASIVGGSGAGCTFSSTGLPSGFSFSVSPTCTGPVVYGNSTVVGPVGYTISVTDNLGVVSTAACTMTVGAAPVVACPANTTLRTGQTFSSSISASSGQIPYTYSLSPSILPLTLVSSSTGLVTSSGALVSSGIYTVSVVDAFLGSNSRACSLTVTEGISVECNTSASFDAGQVLNYPLNISKTVGGYTASILSQGPGSPFTASGFVLTAAGAITGTVKPTASDYTFSYTVRVVDSVQTVATRSCTAAVLVPPNITCPTVSAVNNGTFVSIQIPFGSTGTLSSRGQCIATVTNLPPALTVSGSPNSCTKSFTISGTPNVGSGNFTYSISVIDNSLQVKRKSVFFFFLFFQKIFFSSL